jgi:hypothetical protein
MIESITDANKCVYLVLIVLLLMTKHALSSHMHGFVCWREAVLPFRSMDPIGASLIWNSIKSVPFSAFCDGEGDLVALTGKAGW